jgi:hypothetical protein
MTDAFQKLLAANNLSSDQKLVASVSLGFKAAVAVDGSYLGPLPGSPTLYVLGSDSSLKLKTLEVVDLAALGLAGDLDASREAADLEKFQLSLKDLAAKLKGATILVAQKFVGILPSRLLAQDVRYLLEGDFGLDCLVAAINSALDPIITANVPSKVEPIILAPGQYFLDLKAALAQDPELSSKKILRPFFKATKFETLSLKCDHTPRWLPLEVEQMGYSLAIEKAGEKDADGVMIRLAKTSTTQIIKTKSYNKRFF